MPKKVRRDKRDSASVSSSPGPTSRRVDSVKELLARRAPALMRVTTLTRRANFWSEWLSVHLPPELRPRVSGVIERDGTLVIFAESAAWSARMRYRVLELEPQIRAAAADLTAIEVRVRPR
jgi:predicted nucleic acid-binding Zn ribbon protein